MIFQEKAKVITYFVLMLFYIKYKVRDNIVNNNIIINEIFLYYKKLKKNQFYIYSLFAKFSLIPCSFCSSISSSSTFFSAFTFVLSYALSIYYENESIT